MSSHRYLSRVTGLLTDARFWQWFSFANIIAWAVVWILAEMFGWVHDPAFISRVSMVALLLASLGWWESTRVEVMQQADANVSDVLERLDATDT